MHAEMEVHRMMWEGRKVLVTGGASFIGSHLVDRLIELGANVRVVDNLSSGRLTNLPMYKLGLDFHQGDLRNASTARGTMVDREVVFHLAANHGGRGYVDSHELECAGNMILDQVVLHAASRSRHVKYVVNASSACVYPLGLQEDYRDDIHDTLKEEDVGPGYDADHMYGWAKLMGELVMNGCVEAGGFHGTSLRYFTVYGPRMGVSHAIGAWIAKARAHQDPFMVWGDGQQTRSWIYVDDVIDATVGAAESLILDMTENTGNYTPRALNVGSPDHVKVIDAVMMLLGVVNVHQDPDLAVRLDYDTTQPVGPRHRAADVNLAKEVMDWQPTTWLGKGLIKTVEWFYDTYTQEQAVRMLMKLKER